MCGGFASRCFSTERYTVTSDTPHTKSPWFMSSPRYTHQNLQQHPASYSLLESLPCDPYNKSLGTPQKKNKVCVFLGFRDTDRNSNEGLSKRGTLGLPWIPGGWWRRLCMSKDYVCCCCRNIFMTLSTIIPWA